MKTTITPRTSAIGPIASKRRDAARHRLGHLGRAALAAVTLAAAAVPAQAAVITHSIQFQQISETRGSSPELDFRAALPRFDEMLGTLNQVDIVYNFDIDLDITVTNRTTSPTTVTLGPTALVVEGPRFFDRFSFNNQITSVAIDETLEVGAGRPFRAGSISLVLPTRATSTTELDRRFSRTSRPLQIRNIVLRPQGNVAPFIGTEDLLLDFSARTIAPLALPNFGSVLNGISSFTAFTLAGSVDVTYDFTPAPPVPASAPMSLPLLLTGLMGLVLARRRR